MSNNGNGAKVGVNYITVEVSGIGVTSAATGSFGLPFPKFTVLSLQVSQVLSRSSAAETVGPVITQSPKNLFGRCVCEPLDSLKLVYVSTDEDQPTFDGDN